MNDFDRIRAARPYVTPPRDEVVIAAKNAMWQAEPRHRSVGVARRRRMMRLPIAVGALAAAALVTLIAMRSIGPNAPVGTSTTTPSTTRTQPEGLGAPITLDGVGGASIGMSLQQVQAAWGIKIRMFDEIGQNCAMGSLDTGQVAGSLMFVDDRLVATWFSKGMSTDRGIGLGSTEQAVRTAYTPLRERRDEYVSGQKNLFFGATTTGEPGYRFDINPSGVVSEIGYGDVSVGAAEGCA